MGALKRVLHYLQGTKEFGITYQAQTPQGNSLFYGYADAAYANTEDYKSTLGHVFLAAGGAITWRSKKQTVIALSSMEAEYVALSKASREACWLRNLCKKLGFPESKLTEI